MNICLITNSHPSNDIRLYYKIAKSLAKIGDTYLMASHGVSQMDTNPYQIVVSTESQWFALYKLYHKALKLKPAIVICVEPLTLFVGLALKRKCQSRLVFDVHEFFADAFAERVPALFRYPAYLAYLGAERWLQSKADYTIAVNELILRQLSPSGIKANMLSLPNYPVKNVWDDICEIPSSIHPIYRMNFDLIYIGGLTRDRGLTKMLKSVSLLKIKFPALKVLFVGMFHSIETEKRFIRDLNTYNLNAIVYYQSWLPAEKIGLLLTRARIGLWLFNPKNRRMYNALPLKVLEYLSVGLPVVTVKTPLMNSIVKVNHVGMCVDYSATAISGAIETILTLPQAEYQALSGRCKELINQKFNWEALEPKFLDAMTKLYENSLS